jgi:succinate-semialdehyde dehydrogenase / glutarate-semialdehyde dehydrogenase
MNYPRISLSIAGQARCGQSAGVVTNPASGEVIGEVPYADEQLLGEAVDAAEAAFFSWRRKTPVARSDILRKAALIIRARRDAFAHVLTLEQGKTLSEARGELDASAAIFEWYAEEGRRAYGRIVNAQSTARHLVLSEAIGVCTAFTPWNFPALTPARKIGGALAAGCTLVLKPSEETPATALLLGQALDEAGLPAGVLNIVFGQPALVSSYLLSDARVKKVSFTGSTAVGKTLMALAVNNVVQTTMELGGNAPALVFSDADVEHAAQTLAAFKYRNAGQVCIAPQRILVHKDIYSTFLDRFSEFTGRHRVGDGFNPSVTMGPLSNARRLEAMEKIVADAADKGASVLRGGLSKASSGYFFDPTILANVPSSALAMREEIFGPIAAVTPFDDFENALALANETRAGLAAYAFTGSLNIVTALIEGLEAGMIGVNSTAISTPEAPFGGVKESGHGSEGGIEGLAAYLQTKLIALG